MPTGFFKTSVFFSMTLLTACTTSHLYKARQDYYKLVESELKVQRLFEKGREVFTAKVLQASEELKKRQERYTPGFSITEVSKMNTEKWRHFIVAISLPGEETFIQSDLKFSLKSKDGTTYVATQVREISDRAQIRTLYNYAYPFMRVFNVSFKEDSGSPVESGTLKILSPVGSVSFEDIQ